MTDMPHAVGEDILLTGFPRSGTTLSCWLLNQSPGVVALHEPMDPSALGEHGVDYALAGIAAFLGQQRMSLLSRGTTESKPVGGAVPTNPFAGDHRNEEGLRISAAPLAVVNAGVQQSGFTLVVKHPAMFTALLPWLTQRWPCRAVVRNPLAVLLSWADIDAHIRLGRSPAAELFDTDLSCRLEAERDPLQRQLILLDWYSHMYLRWLAPHQIVRYEDIIATNGAVLSRVSPRMQAVDVHLESRNTRARSSSADTEYLASVLLSSDLAVWDLYSRSEVQALLSDLTDR